MFCFLLAGLITRESRNPAVRFIFPLVRNLPNIKYPLQRTYSPSTGYTSTEMPSGIRPPRNNRISIIFYSFYKKFALNPSIPAPALHQAGWFTGSVLLCHFAITLFSCKWQSAPQDRALLPSQSFTKLHNTLGKSKVILLCSPSRGHLAPQSTHLPLWVRSVLPVFHLCLTAANISCCRRNPQWSLVE